MTQQPSAVWRDVAAILTAQSRRLTREVGVIAAPPATKSGLRRNTMLKAAEQQEASTNAARRST